MKRKLWLIAAAAMICAVMFAVGVSAADYTAADGFAGGMGTEADPYQIATAEQLAYLAESVKFVSTSPKSNTIDYSSPCIISHY